MTRSSPDIAAVARRQSSEQAIEELAGMVRRIKAGSVDAEADIFEMFARLLRASQPATPTGGEAHKTVPSGLLTRNPDAPRYLCAECGNDFTWEVTPTNCPECGGRLAEPARSSAGSAIARLVVAARKVAFEDQGPEALLELDKASEAFAGDIPWDDEPSRSLSFATVLDALIALHAVAKVDRDEDYAAVTNAAVVIAASRSPNDAQPAAHPAEEMIGQIEARFPNWGSYRDLVDCIDCTLHALRGSAGQLESRSIGPRMYKREVYGK